MSLYLSGTAGVITGIVSNQSEIWTFVITAIIVAFILVFAGFFIKQMAPIRSEIKVLEKRMQATDDHDVDPQIFTPEVQDEKRGKVITEIGKEGSYLRNVITEYVSVLKKGGAEKLNTDALIESKAKGRQVFMQTMKFATSVVISLGLLGTFIGLTLSLGALSNNMEMLKVTAVGDEVDTSGLVISESIDGTDEDSGFALVNRLVEAVREPISGMDTAFYTSIAGLIASMIMMAFFNLSYLSNLEKHDTMLAAYLDNMVAPMFATDTESTIKNELKNMASTLEDSVNLFSNRMIEVVSKFSAGLGESTATVNNTMAGLNNVVAQLGTSIRDLDAPIEKFGNKLEAYEAAVKKQDEQIEKIEGLSDDLSEKVIDGLEKGIKTATEELGKSAQALSSSVGASADTLSASVENSIAALRASISQIDNSLDNVRTLSGELITASGGMNISIEEMKNAFPAFGDTILHANGLLDRMRTELETFEGKALSGLVDNMNAYTKNAMQQLEETTRDGIAAGVKEGLTDIRESLATDSKNIAENNGNLKRTYEEFSRSLGDYGATVNLLQDVVKQMDAVMQKVSSGRNDVEDDGEL